MSWKRVTDRERLVEWKRSDGYATIRLRERPDGECTVRFDRLHQAAEGEAYHHETVADREEAMALIEEWKGAFDSVDT